MSFKTHGHVDYLSYGRKLPPRYEWEKDPNNWKETDPDGSKHIPRNRCYHCGSRFVNHEKFAFCNICDFAMSPPNDETVIDLIVDKKEKESKLIYRNEIVKSRVRIPEDKLTEEEHNENMRVAFERANELV